MSFLFRFRTWSVVLMLLSIECLPGATVGAPNLGFVFDPALGAIRPLAGIPGAAILGPAVMSVGHAAFAPGHFGLVGNVGDEFLSIWRPDGSLQTLEGASPADLIVFSPNGSAAVLVRHSEKVVQLLTGLPDSPMVHSQRSVPDGSVAFAVNDQGDLLAGGDLVWLLRGNEAPRQLAVAGPVSALAFQDSDALIAGGGQILLLHNLVEDTEYQMLAAYSDDRTPVLAQISTDATRMFTATSDGEILVLSRAGDEIARLTCQCRPTGFQRLGIGSVYRINDVGNEPVWLLDIRTEPRFWFVPRPLPPTDSLEGSAQ